VWYDNNNGFCPQGDPRWNQSHPQYQEGNSAYNSNFVDQPSLEDLVLGQAKMNEYLTKKFASNDKVLENIYSKLEGLTFPLKNQLSLDKMFETQLAQIADTIPTYDFGKIPGQPEISFENVNAVITRDGKSTRDLPYPNLAGKARKHGGTIPNHRL
jgi:hypothetical protein